MAPSVYATLNRNRSRQKDLNRVAKAQDLNLPRKRGRLAGVYSVLVL
jgi:hypothetical protein